MTTATKTTETTATRPTFNDLVKTYNNDPTDNKALTDLAAAIVCAVLKKVDMTTSNPTIKSMRKTIFVDLANFNGVTYLTETMTTTAYNADGDKVKTVDVEKHKALTDLLNCSISESTDLIHDAIVSIIEQTAKQKDRNPTDPTDLEKPFEIRRLKRKVYIQKTDSHAYETVTTTPIQEIYKAVRRSIMNSRAVQTDPRNGYTYIEDLATDDETSATDTIYRRLNKYADIGGYVTDYNGKNTAYTADNETVETVDNMIENLSLTAKQLQIIKLRLSGYGIKAIATYLGISHQAVAKTLKQIRKKAENIGLTVDNYKAKFETT